MSSCTVRRGFLTLRACGEPAIALCRRCGRPTCAAHLAGDHDHPADQAMPGRVADVPPGRPRGTSMDDQGLVRDTTGAICAECNASQASTDSSVSSDDRSTADAWRYGYRDTYYRESGYRPPSVERPQTDGFRTGGLAAGALATDGFRTGGTFDDLDRESFDPVLAEAGVPLDEDASASLFDS